MFMMENTLNLKQNHISNIIMKLSTNIIVGCVPLKYFQI